MVGNAQPYLHKHPTSKMKNRKKPEFHRNSAIWSKKLTHILITECGLKNWTSVPTFAKFAISLKCTWILKSFVGHTVTNGWCIQSQIFIQIRWKMRLGWQLYGKITHKWSMHHWKLYNFELSEIYDMTFCILQDAFIHYVLPTFVSKNCKNWKLFGCWYNGNVFALFHSKPYCGPISNIQNPIFDEGHSFLMCQKLKLCLLS